MTAKEQQANQKRLEQAVADADKAMKAATESLSKASTESEKDKAQAALDAATEVARTAVIARDSLKAATAIPYTRRSPPDFADRGPLTGLTRGWRIQTNTSQRRNWDPGTFGDSVQ